MSNLVIVESPTKIKTIKKFLNKDDIVLSSKGHIADLAKNRYGKFWLGVDLSNDFEPKYEVTEEKKKLIKEIKDKSNKVDHIYLATDPDREGEAIAWNIKVFAELDSEKTKRISFNELTKDAITNALKNPGEINENLVNSQQARRVLDRIIGFKLSGLLQSKIKSRSAGRVQSVGLKIIVEREKEREAFKPQTYYDISITLENGILLKYIGENGEKKLLLNKETAKKLVDEIKNDGINLKSIIEKKTSRETPSPLKTSTLIQRASSLFGYSASRTMRIAQQLYEGVEIDGNTVGLISYIRTDSTKLSSESKNSIKERLKEQNLSLRGDSKKQTVGKYAQGAHEAIRPTDINIDIESLAGSLSKEQLNLYKLIWFHAVASLMNKAEYLDTQLNFEKSNHIFRCATREIKKKGYLELLERFEGLNKKDEKAPTFSNIDLNKLNLKEGEKYSVDSVESTEKQTKPPSRYRVASLIKKLEDLGVGRPSTYSSIIYTLINRLYIEVVDKAFVPTKQGILTIEKLLLHFNTLIDDKFTSGIEEGLDEISKGENTYLNLVKGFYGTFDEMYEKAKVDMEKIEPTKTGEFCPISGHELVIRKGRYGEFIGCSNYPECKYIKKEKKVFDYVGRTCPLDGGDLIYREARRKTNRKNSKFIGCANFPKCKYIEAIDKVESKDNK